MNISIMSTMIMIVIIMLIPTVQLARPTIKLTLNPDEKYMLHHQPMDIQCELLNPTDRTESPQLWHVDFKTGKRTPISRSLLMSPTEDAPDVFKNNRNKRYDYIRKNSIRIRSLQMEDSAKYECDCPDCAEPITKQAREFYVMRLVEPTWVIESGWPLHENTKTQIKCQADNFYPYINHKILRHQKEITNEGKSSLSNSNAFPQKFVWESTITPTAEWHNTTLTCIVRQGNAEQSTTKTLDVLFTPTFLKCAERQFVDVRKDQSIIECSYSGNPQPILTWFRKSDQKAITADNGISVDVKDEQQGRYRSIVTFDRNRLMLIPLLANHTSGENYYQQLLNNGFIVKLTANNNDRGTRLINIVSDASQIEPKLSNRSTPTTTTSLSSIFCAVLFILHMVQR